MSTPDTGRDTLRDRVSAALELRRDEVGDHAKRWKAETAEALKVDPRTFENWLYAETLPDAYDLMALYDYFGADFEAEVRGEREVSEESPAVLAGRLARKLRDMESGK